MEDRRAGVFQEAGTALSGHGHRVHLGHQDRERDAAAARRLWARARPFFKDPEIDIVLLDEITYMFKFGYLPVGEVVDALSARPPRQHVMLTGRDAIPELLEIADTVSEVKAVRHAFDHGVKAQKGIEF